jgi:RHS repeat-associated protein
MGAAEQITNVTDPLPLGRVLQFPNRTKYFYDKNGNLTSKQAKGLTGEVVNYSYSSNNQLTYIRYYQPAVGSFDPSHLWTPVSTLAKEVRYFYDALGRRVKKVVIDSNATTDLTRTFARQYVYDGQEILLEYNGSSEVLAHHTHSGLGTDDVLATDVTQEGVNYALAQSAGTYMFLKDSQGSVVDVTDAMGNRVQHHVYSAYGVQLAVMNGAGIDVTVVPPLRTSYSYTGRELDSESGLLYYRARYYDPAVGRFMQKDPHPGLLELPSSVVNSYIYALNNPLNRVDPSGGFSWLERVIIGVVAAVVAVVAVVLTPFTGGASTVMGSIIIGALIGAVAGAAAGAVAGVAINVYVGRSWKDSLLEAVLIGAAVGAVAGGIAGYATAAPAATSQTLADAEWVKKVKEDLKIIKKIMNKVIDDFWKTWKKWEDANSLLSMVA